VDLRGEPVRLARDGLLDPGLFGVARLTELGRAALAELSAKLGAGIRGADVPLFLALPEARPGFGARESSAVARALAAASDTGAWKGAPRGSRRRAAAAVALVAVSSGSVGGSDAV
jgi:hypothetical protein